MNKIIVILKGVLNIRYNYFVSYAYNDQFDRLGYRNCSIETNVKIKNEDDISVMQERICEENNLKNVVIIHFAKW